MQSDTAERETSHREWRRPREFPEGVYALSSFFIDNSINCAARVTISVPWPKLNHHHHHHYSLLCYSRQNRSLWSQRNQETANWIPRSSPPERTQCRQGSSSYRCSTQGDCSTSWNDRLIDGGKLTCSTSSDVPVPLMIPSLFSPLPKPRSSSTKGIFFGPPGTGKICLSKYTLCCRSSIPTYLFGWCPDEAEIRAHRNIYVVSGPGLVQALCKTSCIESFFSTKMTKLDKVIFIEILALPF